MMLSASLQIIFIFGIRNSVAASPFNLLELGFKNFFFDHPAEPSSNQYANSRTTSFQYDHDKRRTEKKEKEMKYLYGKPIEDKMSVIDSLFEMNVREIIEATTTLRPTVLKKYRKKVKDESDSSLWSVFQDINFLPLVKDNHIPDKNHYDLDKKTVDYLDSIRDEVWIQFKSLLTSYINSLDSLESTGYHRIKDSLPVKMFLNFLDMGDKVNIVHLLGKKVDPEAASFLIKKLKEAAPELLNLKNIIENNVTAIIPPLNNMVNKFSWLSLRHIIDHLIVTVNNTYSEEELENYIEDLEHTNTVAAKGLKFVLNLPSNMPFYDEKGLGRSFSGRSNNNRYSDRGGYGYRDDGYHDEGYDDRGSHDDSYGYESHGSHGSHGGHGGYGDHDSHYVGGKLDPYLILAGIGTAALLTFVAFKVLQTTTAQPTIVKRSVDELGFDLTAHITNSIDHGYEQFGGNLVEESEEVIEGINTLWNNKGSKRCQKCVLHDILVGKMFSNNRFKLIILSTFGQIFGIEKSGQLLDEITSDFLNGIESTCVC